MFRRLAILLLITSPLRAAGEETPAVMLERGLFLLEGRHDPIRARAVLLEVLTVPKVPPRVAAEALWLLAQACLRQGSDETAILVLNKLTRDFPAAQPFAAAASALAVELAGSTDVSGDSPNPADASLSEDLAHLAAAALQLGEVTEAAAAFQELDDVLAFILFEVAIADPDAQSKERRQRRNALRFYRDAQDTARKARADLASGTSAAAVLKEHRKVLADLQERELDPFDLNIALCATRDALAKALGTGDAATTAAAAREFQTAAQTITAGPPELALVHMLQGEVAAATAAAALTAERKGSEALRTWRLSRRMALLSGSAGAGLVIEDAADIPAALRPRVLGAILFVESALTALQIDADEAAAKTACDEAITRLTALAREAGKDVKYARRLDRTIQRLTEAHAAIGRGETGRAAELLRTEMYVTP